MAYEPICNGVYHIGNTETISLPIHIPGIPETVDVEGYTLKRRSEFHVSLVCIGRIRERFPSVAKDFTEDTIREFCAYVAQRPVVFVAFRNEFRFVSFGEQKTLVAMADVSHLAGFFNRLNEKHGLALEYPPTHVTLYTLDGKPGIFLLDSNDIKERTKTVPNPGLVLP